MDVNTEKFVFGVAYARLFWLAVTCPCDPLFKCHDWEVSILAAATSAWILWRQFGVVWLAVLAI